MTHQENITGKILRKNNPAIALNVLYVQEMNIYSTFISKHNSNHEEQIILLIISKALAWHYLAVKELPGLLKLIMPKYDSDFYCFNCLHSFRTKNKLESR